MIPAQLNTLCAAYGNVDGMSLHSASGTDDADMIGTKQALTWGTPTDGLMTSTATFTAVTGSVCFVRVWDGATFIDEFSVNGGVGVEIAGQDVTAAVQHKVRA